MNMGCELRMARGLTRDKRKLTVTQLRCRDRRLVHRPSGADSLDGAIQPEGTPAGSGQCQPVVDELIGRQNRQARADPKLDAEELSVFGDWGNRRSGFR